MKKILVTGAAGFIGFHLVNRLCKSGYDIIGIDNLNDYYDISLKEDRLNELKPHIDSKKFLFYKEDITDLKKLENLFKENHIDLIIHLAAQAGVRYSLENPHAYIQSNIVGFMNILECCRYHKIDKLIYASSSSVYGGNEKTPFSEDDRVDSPISIYAVTKKSNELMAYTYSHLYNITMIGLRFFTVYGPWGRPDMSPHIFTDNIINNKKIKIFNNGKHTRSFTYIDDIIESMYRLIDIDSLKFEKYLLLNIGGENPINLMDYISLIENTLSKKAKYEFLPRCYAEMDKTSADTKELSRLTGYSPTTKIEDGIELFLDWYLKYYKIKPYTQIT